MTGFLLRHGLKAISAPDLHFLMREPLETRLLRYFLETTDAGNFSHSAKRLRVSQPAISQQMRDLEDGVRPRLELSELHGQRLV